MRTVIRELAIGAGVLTLAATSASTQTNVDPQYKDYHDSRLRSLELAPTNEACGSQITASFDWPSYHERAMGPTNAYAYCGAALAALREMCGQPGGREAVRRHVSNVVCGFGEPGARDVSLKNGTLTFIIDWTSPGNVEFIEAYLRGAL